MSIASDTSILPMHTYIYIYVVNVNLMICNRFGIHGGLVEDSVFVSLKISLKILWQSILPHPLPQKRIVKKSLKFRPRSRCFNSSLTKFRRYFFVAKRCGKTFCHKAPDEKSNEIPTKGKSINQRHKSLYQNILQVVAFHGGFPLQYIIYVYISIIIHTYEICT